jgi:hypothetical protein
VQLVHRVNAALACAQAEQNSSRAGKRFSELCLGRLRDLTCVSDNKPHSHAAITQLAQLYRVC